MELIEPSAKLVLQSTKAHGGEKHVERCGRVCYKSEGKITESSYIKFNTMLATRGHLSPFEHETIYMIAPSLDDAEFLGFNPYTRINYIGHSFYITTNRRVLSEHDLLWFWNQYKSQPTDKHHKRYTLNVICDRGVSHELVRHRAMSFSQESTRYCDYTGCMQFVIPSRWAMYTDEMRTELMLSWSDSEKKYKTLRSMGLSPQEARCVLPNALKTEMYITGYHEQWVKLVEERTASGVQPDAVKVAKLIAAELYTETKDERFKIN